MSQLPSNATELERALEFATDEETDVPLRLLVNPDTCPEHILPWLAWAWSVDRWDNEWSVPTKRAAIRSAFEIHARKGTIGALRRVAEPIGYLLTVTEWWQTDPPGEPGTFSIEVGVSSGGITETAYREVERLLDDARPVSRHIVGLDIRFEPKLQTFTAVVAIDGDILDVYPRVIQ
ncbi:phage tail protein I [Pseudomonas aeruginosa]